MAREASQAGPRHPQQPLDLLEFAGLLEGPEGLADRVEHLQQHQGQVLVHVEASVAGAVAPAAGVMEAFEKTGDLLEVLEARQVAFFDLASFGMAHAPY